MKVFEWLDKRATTLGERIGSPFERITEWMEEALQDKLTGAAKNFFEDYEQEITEPLKPILAEVLKNPNLPPEIRKMVENVKDPSAFAFAPLLLAAAGLSVMPAIGASMSGGIMQIRQASMQQFKPSLLNPDEAISAFWRGMMDDDELKKELEQHGFNDERQKMVEQVRRYIPNANDLIRFTVRDVFREDIVKKFGYDADFDKTVKELEPWLESIGMDEETMRLYWRAHWMLPSIGQAFEMLHRGEITLDDIRDLLRIADVAPAWVEPLIKIAYSPYTRVDVRRMYDAGVIDKEAVMRSYLDLGYDDEHANNLTEWTITQAMSTERDLSKSEIITAYAQGAITATDASAALIDMGYDADEAELILSIQDYKTDNKILQREKKILINRFARGDLLIEELTKELGTLGLSERETSITVEEARNKVREKTASPTKADLIKWLNAKIISSESFMQEMRLKGYSQQHIDNYILAEG